MALIFFEGFNRTPSTNFWTLSPDSAGGRRPIISTTSRTGVGGLYIQNSPMTTGSYPSAKLSFGTHTAKKIYIGFAVQNWTAGDSTAKYLSFYDSSSAECFSVWFDDAGVTDQNTAGLNIKQGSTAVARFLITSASNTSTAVFNGRYTTCGNYGCYEIRPAISGWNYFEFEIDLNNSTLAIRRNGMTLYTQSGATQLAALTTTVSSLSAFEFLAASETYAQPLFFDDLYVIDDTGSTTNTWLGPTVAVHSPMFDLAGPLSPEQWVGAGGNTATNATIFNSDNGDVSYIKTWVFDRVQAAGITVTPDPDNAVIAGITIASSARNVTLPAAYKQVYVPQSSSTAYDLSNRISLTGTTYTKTYNTLTANPATGLPWTLDDINNGTFGVKSVDPS